MLSQRLLRNDPARVINVKQRHRNEHQCRIEDVDEVFVGKQETTLPHHILRNTEHGSDHDHQTGTIEHEKIALPWDCQLLRACTGHDAEAVVEDSRDDYEETEEEDLDTQTASNDVFASGRITG